MTRRRPLAAAATTSVNPEQDWSSPPPFLYPATLPSRVTSRRTSRTGALKRSLTWVKYSAIKIQDSIRDHEEPLTVCGCNDDYHDGDDDEDCATASGVV